MSPAGILSSDPDLELVTINDFTPGVINGTHSGPIFSTEPPMGSASYAVRCHGKKNLGLRPLPTYTVRSTHTKTEGITSLMTMADMIMMPGGTANLLVASYSNAGVLSGSASFFDMYTYVDPPTGMVESPLFNGPSIPSPVFGSEYWPNLSSFFTNQAVYFTVGVFSFVPVAGGAFTWVMTPNPATGTGNVTGSMTESWHKVAFQTNRFVFMGPPSGGTGGNQLGSYDEFFTSDIQANTNLIGGEFFFPEKFGWVGAWGTVSTGEFVIIGQSGGAIVIYGDIQIPSTAIYLPGVVGTGSAIGPATSTPIGLVYATDFDGVWVWNGGNTSEKISDNIVDSVFTRILPPGATACVSTPASFGSANSAYWMNWIFFPNNWMYDIVAQSWWQCEDPNVTNFQVFAGYGNQTQYFYASPGNAFTTTGGPLNIPICRFDHSTPASSYTWISNPIPASGSLVSLEAVEICASNPTSVPATIVVTPVPPPNQSPVPLNATPTQPVTFTIPPTTAAYRAAQRLGYTDYNVCVQVQASALSPNSAPTLHELSCGVSRRPSFTP